MIFNLKKLQEELEVKKSVKKIDKNFIPPDYKSVVDENILNIKFELDIFQKQAFYYLKLGKSIFISAHTSSGKTLIAEYAIKLSEINKTRVIYTSPIKALSNQKFFEFNNKFDDVGIITGDIQVNSDGRCLIMTTEILRNLIFNNSNILSDVEFVIFDEVHYISDDKRGFIWEEILIMLSKKIRIILLSAKIPNALEFSEWIGRIKKTCIYVISNEKRPVPLEFAVYLNSEAFLLQSKSKMSNFSYKLPLYKKEMKQKGFYKVNEVAHFIINRKLTPAIFFVLSKKCCENYCDSLKSLDLTSFSEKKKIAEFIDKALLNLNENDRFLPQILNMKERAIFGIGSHHSSLLPFIKECIEILFSLNLIKILIATETFAIGINMPAKTCVFFNLSKIENSNFRFLSTAEFIQMSGRAGRRGMDKVGTVLIADKSLDNYNEINRLITGHPKKLISKFKLSFNLIFKSIIGNHSLYEIMKNSFCENNIQKDFEEDSKKLISLEKNIKKIENTDIFDFLNIIRKFNNNYKTIKKVLKINDIIITKQNSIKKVLNLDNDFVYVTNSTIKLEGNLFNKKLPEEFSDRNNNDDNFPEYPPIYYKNDDITKINYNKILFLVKNKNISLNYKLDRLNSTELIEIINLSENYKKLINFKCLFEEDFYDKYFLGIDQLLLRKKIKLLKFKYLDEHLIHFYEYSNRYKLLEKYNFINSYEITLKGRAAAEITAINDVLVTEIIFNNVFNDINENEILSILSIFINNEYETDYIINKDLEIKCKEVIKIYEKINLDLIEFNLSPFENYNLKMVQPVFDWACGISLGKIVTKYKISEGNFVKIILRLNECCRELLSFCEITGDLVLENKIKEANSLINRDIVLFTSLYI